MKVLQAQLHRAVELTNERATCAALPPAQVKLRHRKT